MATYNPQAQDSEYREHVAAPVASSADAMALDNHVNGDATQHNALPEFAQADARQQEIIETNPLPSKIPQRSPSPPIEHAPLSATPLEPVAAPRPEPVPTVETHVSETTTTQVHPDMSATVTTSIEVPPPEPPAQDEPQRVVTVSPEKEAEPATALEIASDVGQPIISDERNAPFEEETKPAEELLPAVVETTEQTVHIPVETLEASEPLTQTLDAPKPSEVDIKATIPPVANVPVTEVSHTEVPVAEAPVVDLPAPTAPIPDLPLPDQKMEDIIPSSGKIAREREEDDEVEPEAKRTKTETEPETEDHIVVESAEVPVPAPIPTADLPVESASNDVTMTTITEQPVATGDAPVATPTAAPTVADTAAESVAAVDAAEVAPPENWGPLTDAQSRQLRQTLQNLKKGRHATFFSKPVDPVALKIPTYPDIIKNPMDLGTMEQKLKEGKYGSVNEFVADFNLIINNSIAFNGATHAVSLAGMNLKAQFGAGLKKIPKAGEVVPPPQSKKQRRSSFALPARETKRRESRPSLGGASSPTGNTANQTFALGLDGVPLTRRTSTAQDGRPKREIHKPPPRDLPYSSVKPKKKKFQLELKFCEYVLGELKRGRYAEMMNFFALPVDPVALNIPDYHKYIKKPMDFRTITDKLHSGQYENAKEFENDVRLVFGNCYKFNGPTHPIAQSGKALENVFDEFWAGKQSWIAQNAPPSAPQSPEADSQSDEDEEEEEEDDEEDERAAQIASLQEKIAELSAQAVALTSAPATKKTPKVPKKKADKPKKGGAPKANRKSGSLSGPTQVRKPEKKSKPKPKAKPITMKEKAEIAERIGELSVEDTALAANLIKKGLRKIGSDLADRPDEELEFDIDQIPDDVLSSLLKLVRKNDPPAKESRPSLPTTKSDSVSKPKKNKPMGKHEQEDAIRRLTSQIETFQNPDAAGGSEGSEQPSSSFVKHLTDPRIATGQDALSSDDEDDSGSESEEE